MQSEARKKIRDKNFLEFFFALSSSFFFFFWNLYLAFRTLVSRFTVQRTKRNDVLTTFLMSGPFCSSGFGFGTRKFTISFLFFQKAASFQVSWLHSSDGQMARDETGQSQTDTSGRNTTLKKQTKPNKIDAGTKTKKKNRFSDLLSPRPPPPLFVINSPPHTHGHRREDRVSVTHTHTYKPQDGEKRPDSKQKKNQFQKTHTTL